MAKQDRFSTILKTVGTCTAGCGITAIGVALFTAVNAGVDTQFLEPLFNTTIHLFSAGVGAILGILGSQLSTDS